MAVSSHGPRDQGMAFKTGTLKHRPPRLPCLFCTHHGPLKSAAPTCVGCAPLPGKHWAPEPFISCFSPSFTYLSIQGFDAFSQHLTPKPNETFKKTYPLFEWNISQKYLTPELCQTPKLALILKGHWIPNTMDPCGSHFPIKDLGGGDGLQLIKMRIWCLAAPWPRPLSIDHQGLCIEWQMRAEK